MYSLPMFDIVALAIPLFLVAVKSVRRDFQACRRRPSPVADDEELPDHVPNQAPVLHRHFRDFLYNIGAQVKTAGNDV